MATVNIPITGIFNALSPRNDFEYTPHIQTINMYAGDDGYVQLNVMDGYGNPYNISTGACILTVTNLYDNTTPLISREAIVLDAYDAYFIIDGYDTLINPAVYNYDVVYIDVNGSTTHLIKQSQFNILKSSYVPGNNVTVPPAQQPLAQGPINNGVVGGSIGFYGTTPIAQQSATGITTVAQLVQVLKNLGLLGT